MDSNAKGEIIIQIGREHQFEAFVKRIGKPEWAHPTASLPEPDGLKIYKK